MILERAQSVTKIQTKRVYPSWPITLVPITQENPLLDEPIQPDYQPMSEDIFGPLADPMHLPLETLVSGKIAIVLFRMRMLPRFLYARPRSF